MSSKETAEAILLVIKRIGKWIFLFSLVLFLLGLLFLAYTRIENYYQNLPQVVDKLKGISLGEKFEDFMFRNPGFVAEVERNKKSNDQSFYENKDKSTLVRIKDNKVERILYKCLGENDYTDVNGVRCRASGDDIFIKHEKKVTVKCLRDKSSADYLRYRVYDVFEFGIRYHVVGNEIVAFDVANSVELNNLESSMNSNWASCG
jgi:hypothetical protein